PPKRGIGQTKQKPAEKDSAQGSSTGEHSPVSGLASFPEATLTTQVHSLGSRVVNPINLFPAAPTIRIPARDSVPLEEQGELDLAFWLSSMDDPQLKGAGQCDSAI